ncbi:hypothetical protein AMJ86_06055 [bacterium SM23_57]|nr:MAG: hypothetical protein AMJ86_06055 [bacterium SM23_57]
MSKNPIHIHPKCSLRTSWFMLALLMLIFLASGCDKNPTEVEDYNPQPILSAFIYNGRMIDHIFLDRVAPLDGYYHPDDWFIFDADVMVYPVDNPEAGDTVRFREHHRIELGWFYLPKFNNYIYAQSRVRYRIEVRKPTENIDLWAETVVPDTIALTVPDHEVIDDTIWIPLDWNDCPLRLEWTPADSAGGYVLSTICQNIDPITGLHSLPLVPLDPNFDYDEPPDIQYLDVFRSNVLSTDVPAQAFNYVGLHKVMIQATSYDYVEYLESLFNAFETNPISNVHGGRGVFSGCSSRHVILTMKQVRQP